MFVLQYMLNNYFCYSVFKLINSGLDIVEESARLMTGKY